MLRGPDEVGIRRRLQQLKDDADGGTGMLSTNLVVLEGRDAKGPDILAAALTPPFLAPRRLVIVERFTDRFVARARSSSDGQSDTGDDATSDSRPIGSDARQSRTMDALKPMIDQLIEGLPETTTLVFTGGDSGRNQLADRLKGVAGFKDETFPELKGDQLIRYIRAEAAARGVRLRGGAPTQSHYDSSDWLGRRESDPASLLAALTQGDTLRISSELDKLALYSMGKDVTVDTVYELCSGEREATMFKLADAVMDGRTLDAFDVLPRAMATMESEQLLFSGLIPRYRQLALVQELVEEGASGEEIGSVMGNAGKYPGLREAAIRRARRHGRAGVRAAFAAIAAADRSIKEREVDAEIAVEILIADLAQAATMGAKQPTR